MVTPPSSSGPHVDLSLTDQELLHRLGWFIHIRWVVGVFCLVLLIVGHTLLGVQFVSERSVMPIWRPIGVVIGLFAYNTIFAFLVGALRSGSQITRRRILRLGMGQIACDLLGVCALVHTTGGVENVFIVLAALPLVIASELLPPALSYGAAAGAAILIHALAWGEQQGVIAHVSVLWGDGTRTTLWRDPFYVLEVTGAMTVALFGTVFLAATIAGQLRRREQDLEAAYQRIRLTDEAKSFFMRKTSHELRSPLVAIGTILKGILHTVNTMTPEHRRLLDRAWQRTDAAMAVLDDLRQYARLHSDQRPREPQVVDMARLVNVVADLLRPQAESTGLRLTCLVERACVNGDEELLREVVNNLAANAMQYTLTGGRIDLAVRREGAVVQLRVSDTGIGLSEQARGRLFEEFFRAEEAKKVFAHGTGLGLAICKRIVEMHGGKISAANREGGGSVFTVELPACESATAERPAVSMGAMAPAGQS